jgi:hypothetical protein
MAKILETREGPSMLVRRKRWQMLNPHGEAGKYEKTPASRSLRGFKNVSGNNLLSHWWALSSALEA